MGVKISVLERFRDRYLRTSIVGRSFVEAYYRYSPPVADYISHRAWLRAVVRTVLLPVVGFVSMVV